VTGARAHLAALSAALGCLAAESRRLEAWGAHLARILPAGARVLVAGNGGSAAEAQHLSAELVGRYRDDRAPLAAIALHADTSALTAMGNDYGFDEVFARGVAAHGRAGDVLLGLSTSGTSANLLRAVRVARERGLTTWALTGCTPNPLAAACDDALCVPCDATPTIQEVHLVAVHLLCEAVEQALRAGAVEGAREVVA
jgi:D-sedoheptulose 7-phosphate isomerase